MSAALHDPGGKSKFALQDGVSGSALFSGCGRYRYLLRREWGERPVGVLPTYALWIGLNPSTAEGDVDDPTVRREVNYTRDMLGLPAYMKANVSDYRATNPKDLLRLEREDVCTHRNLETIIHFARHAEIVIAAWGAADRRLGWLIDEVEMHLRNNAIPLWCVGLTKDGSPRHPLYVKKDAPLLPYAR